MGGRLAGYSEYRDSGIDWIGHMPTSWKISRIKFFARLNPSKQEVRSLSSDTEVTFLPMEAIGEKGELDVSSSKNLGEVINGYTYVGENDVLIAKITPCFENRKGSIARGLKNEIGFATTEVIPFRVLNKKNNRFLYYLLSCNPFRQIAEGAMYGAGGQKRVGDSFIANYHFAKPSAEECDAIANFLDHETAKIDTLINKQQQLVKLLKEKRDILVHEAFEHPAAIECRFSNIADLIMRPIDRRPEEIFTPIGLFNRGRGIFHKDKTLGDDLGDSDFFWVKQGDLIFSGQFAWEGAISLASEDDNGCVVSHRYPVVRGKKGIAETPYLFAALATRHGDFLLNEHSRGAAGRNRPLNISFLFKEKIPLPPLAVQEKISQLIEIQRKFEKAVAKKIKILQERRTALISAAVTGKIDVRDWKPEPSEQPMEATA